MYFHESKEFINNLDKYLFNSNQTSANFLLRNKGKIPSLFRNYHGNLFRGMFVDTIDKDIKISKISSWTKEKSIATKFVKDPKFIVQQKKSKAIIATAKMISNSIIIDIDAYVSFYGMDKLISMGFDELNIDSASKEQEVLLSPLTINKDGIELLR